MSDKESYPRIIGPGTPDELKEERDRLWGEDLAAGTESEEEAAYRLRVHSMENGDLRAVTCDGCGERPGFALVHVVGSPEGILQLADEQGWTVPNRWGLEGAQKIPDVRGLMSFSARVFVLCEECSLEVAGGDSLTYGENLSLTEPGYEEHTERYRKMASRDPGTT